MYSATGTLYSVTVSEGVNQVPFGAYDSKANPQTGDFGVGADTQLNKFSGPYPFNSTLDEQLKYTHTIEKSFWLQNQIAQHQTPDYTPFIHYGVMPVPSNPALASAESFSSCVLQWQVECELMCDVNLNSINPYYNIPYLKKWDPIQLTAQTALNSGQVITMANRRTRFIGTAPAPTTNLMRISR